MGVHALVCVCPRCLFVAHLRPKGVLGVNGLRARVRPRRVSGGRVGLGPLPKPQLPQGSDFSL